MKLLVYANLAAIVFVCCFATGLPPYCGVNVEEYTKASEGTLKQVHVVMRYSTVKFISYCFAMLLLLVYHFGKSSIGLSRKVQTKLCFRVLDGYMCANTECRNLYLGRNSLEYLNYAAPGKYVNLELITGKLWTIYGPRAQVPNPLPNPGHLFVPYKGIDTWTIKCACIATMSP